VNLLLHPTVTGPTPFTAMTSCELLDGVPSNNLVSGVTQVIEPSAVLAQTARIDIPRLGPANPYPSTIFVSGLTAAVYSVRVVVTNLTHTYPEDIDMLLVGPNGAAVLLMSDAGSDFPVQNITLTFDDDGARLP